MYKCTLKFEYIKHSPAIVHSNSPNLLLKLIPLINKSFHMHPFSKFQLICRDPSQTCVPHIHHVLSLRSFGIWRQLRKYLPHKMTRNRDTAALCLEKFQRHLSRIIWIKISGCHRPLLSATRSNSIFTEIRDGWGEFWGKIG